MTFSEILQQVISLARAANQARTAAGPDDDSPLVASDQQSSLNLQTAEERRLREFLETQPPPVLYMLTAIMYLGRGDFDVKDLPDQYADTSETFGGPKGAARLMFQTVPLPEYLEEGRKKLADARIDTDKLLAD
ncbi:MAG: DUF3775 domain-containing protein [Planctomycetes bacterium]|nr:DUF3775 domain-containing protein [Planctomycetota bacterium]